VAVVVPVHDIETKIMLNSWTVQLQNLRQPTENTQKYKI